MKSCLPETDLFEYLGTDSQPPRILILEEENAALGSRLSMDLAPAYRVLSYTHPYPLIHRLDRAIESGEQIHGVIISQVLSREAFLHFLSYIARSPALISIMLYYFKDQIFYGFRGGRRLFANPCKRADTLRLQIDAILNSNNTADASLSAKASA